MKVGVRGLYVFLLVGSAPFFAYKLFQVPKRWFFTVKIVQNNSSEVLSEVNSSGTDLPKSELHDTLMIDSVFSERFDPNRNIFSPHLHTVSDGQHAHPVLRSDVPSNMVEERRLVLILSYQRCGSTFFGRLFDQHPGGIHTYEPLDGLYAAMYGTPEGWNVPSDIMNWSNGSQRALPVDESSAVTTFLHDLLTCHYDRLPTEFLLHKFRRHARQYESHLAPFIDCLVSTGLPVSAQGRCGKLIKDMCSQRFNKDIKKQSMCHDSLWNTNYGTQFHQVRSNDNSSIAQFSSCMKEHRIQAADCIRKLKLVCDAAGLRSTKTVRATMNSVEMLLRTLPTLRVIHLIRDPRAVVLSRKNFHASGQSLYANGNVTKESKVFCQNLVSDINIRNTLEEKYPGRIMEVLYDRFVKDPLNQTELIYNFLDVPLSPVVKSWVARNTRSKQPTNPATNNTNSKIVKKRPYKLSMIETMNINNNCQGLFYMIDYDWDTS